jgi:hypothetical protein
MRYRPIQAASRERAPLSLLGPSRARTALAAVAATAAAFAPIIMVASPAQASVTNPSSVANLTITDAGNWEGGQLTFKVTYNGANPGYFEFGTNDGTAHGANPLSATDGTEDFDTHLSRSDFTFSGTASGGSNSTTVTVTTQADDDVTDEAFQLVATDTNGDTKTGAGTIWAVADANYPAFSLKGPTTSVPETATSGVQKKVTVTAQLTKVLPHPITIPVATTDGNIMGHPEQDATSSNGEFRDYDALPANTVITIPAYTYTGTVDVTLHDDAVYEPPVQYFTVDASGVNGATAGTPSATIGIKDDDAVPSVSIGAADPATEGDYLHFPVKVSGLSELPVDVNANTTDGSRLADSNPATATGVTPSDDDYDFASNTPSQVEIAPFTWSKYYDVNTNTDANFEGPENVKAVLSGTAGAGTLVNATMGSPTTAYGVINDGSAGPTITTSTAAANNGNSIPTGSSFAEGASGEAARKIHVSIGTGTFAVPVKVDYAFKDLTATNGVDYRGASGSYTFPANTTVDDGFDIPVTIIGDTIKEGVAGSMGQPDFENFEVDFTSSTSTVTPVQSTIRITEGNDDVIPTWSMGNVSVAEGNTGTTTAKVPVTLTAPAADDTTFALNLTDASAIESGVNTGANAGANDYDWPTDRTLTIKAGSTVGYFMIPINADTVYEHDETFVASATDTSGNINDTPAPGTLQSGVVTITNDDAKPSLTFNNVSASEGSLLRVTGTINGQSQYEYKLGFSVAAAATDPATAGVDFDAPDLTNESLTVPRGTTGSLTATTLVGTHFPYSIYLSPDNIDEPTEAFTFTATETTPSPTGFDTSVGTFKITDDPADLPPAASIRDESIKETEGSVDVHVDMSFDSTNGATSSTQTVNIPWYTLDGTAKAGEDYTRKTGTLSVPAGTTTATVNVPIINDKVKEGTEHFYVKLGTPTPAGAAIDKGTSEVTILDNGNGTTPPPSNGGPSIMAPTWVTGSVAVPVTGKATAGATVDLWGAAWSPANPKLVKLDSTKADASGNYKFSRWIGTGYRFQVAVGDAMSAEVKVGIAQAPVFVASSPSKGKLSVAVQGNPRGPKQTVIVQAWVGGKWVNTWKGMTGTNNVWKATVSQKSKSSWTLRAFVQGDMNWGINGGYSAAKKITIK